MQIDGSGALVAGGASGLGQATARRLHQAGAHVVIADLKELAGRSFAQELGERASFLTTDVTDPATVQAAVDSAAALPGGLRISICCAGIGWGERVAGKRGPHQPEAFETVVGGNLIGIVLNNINMSQDENYYYYSGYYEYQYKQKDEPVVEVSNPDKTVSPEIKPKY